jgi:alkanesulfonate monooxygenase SsuD/methylene tetrahydromethanopterin reductase-like flavin-dependent oxidoreductase (luciferase family)
VLLPFRINHPLRVAERIATLDVLSNGRVDFGGGRAISESELNGFEVDPEVTRAQWEESLSIIPKAWTEDTFSWESPAIRIPECQAHQEKGSGLELPLLLLPHVAKKTPHFISQDLPPYPLSPLPTAKVLAAVPAADTDPSCLYIRACSSA